MQSDYNLFLAKLPSDLKEKIGDSSSEEISIGQSGAATFFLQDKQHGGRYLKMLERTSGESLRPEKERLEWLQGRLPVPQVLYFGEDETHEYLLLSEIPGLIACDEAFENDLSDLVHLLAVGLKMVHSVKIEACPFDQTLAVQLEAARQRTLAGLVDESDFDENRLGMTAPELYAQLLATRPDHEDLVFTHGDYCLPNILIGPDLKSISGFIDLGRAGIADRYQDLALAARSVEYNFGVEWVSLLFKEYGLTEPDYGKIEFYKLLDEFF